MKLKDLFKSKAKEQDKTQEKETEQKDRVRFIFEMPRSEVNDFVNGIWARGIFSVVLKNEEVERVGELITKKQKEVVFSYGK